MSERVLLLPRYMSHVPRGYFVSVAKKIDRYFGENENLSNDYKI